MANNNDLENIQLKFELPNTHFILYNGEKYPINFDIFKFSSKYFYELRHEISEYSDINLESYDPDENISQFSPEEVYQFIKYIQYKTIQLTNENVATLHYFGHKYKIEQLILSTEKYINNHEEDICLKFLKRKELHAIIDLNYYENLIASKFIKYADNDDMINLDISTLHRILEKASKINEDGGFESAKNEFLMKILSKHGRPASILFKYADINSFDDESLTNLLTKYSDDFEFEYITASALKVFLNMKNFLEKERREHLKYQEESRNKYEKIKQDLLEQKQNNEEMKKLLEKEHQEHLKCQKEFKCKCEKIEHDYQKQIKYNKEMKNLLEKEHHEHLKYQEESKNKYEKIEQDYLEQIKYNEEMKNLLKKERQEHLNDNTVSKNSNDSIFHATQNDNAEINTNIDELLKTIDLDSPCLDTSDLIKRTLIVYKKEFNITSSDEPIKEMCDKLQHFIEEHRNDFLKSVTSFTIQSLFDNEITVYKKAYVFCDKTWNEIRTNIIKLSKLKMANEQVIFAIGSMIQQSSSSQTEPKFKLCFVTRTTELPAIRNTLFETEKQVSNSVPSRNNESTEKLELEIANIVRGIARNNKSLKINSEISDRIRQEITNGRGKDWENNEIKEIKEMVSNEIEYPWARFYFNMRYDELINKIKTEYKNLFSRKIAFAKVLVVSAIDEDISSNTFSVAVITGQVKINSSYKNNNIE